MKKLFISFHNQNGFLFPYVLFTAVLACVIVSSSVVIHKNNTNFASFYKEQLKMNTLTQMGISLFKEEIGSINTDQGSRSYSFPYGNVKIHYQKKEETMVISCYVTTSERASYVTTQTFPIP
jgi:hypothetical protein